MSNGMPSWEEWDKQLSEEQRRYSLYKVLSDLYHRDCDREQECRSRLNQCETEFDRISDLELRFDNRRRFDAGVAATAGFVGGAIVSFIKWIMGR